MTRHPKGTTFSHYRTHAGAEVDLVLENPSGETVALEIKRTLSPKLTPGFLESMKTLEATKGYYIIPQGETFPLSESVTAISLSDYLARLP
jgi:predicted AAA+ superfamily ATPase